MLVLSVPSALYAKLPVARLAGSLGSFAKSYMHRTAVGQQRVFRIHGAVDEGAHVLKPWVLDFLRFDARDAFLERVRVFHELRDQIEQGRMSLQLLNADLGVRERESKVLSGFGCVNSRASLRLVDQLRPF